MSSDRRLVGGETARLGSYALSDGAPGRTEFAIADLAGFSAESGGPSRTAETLERALRCRANVLVTGDLRAARRFFREAYPGDSLKILPAAELNRSGIEALRAGRGERPCVLYLEHVEHLDSWMQVALLDALETSPHAGDGPRFRRVISTAGPDLATRVALGRFSRSLFLRLGTLRVDVPGRPTRGRSRPRAERKEAC